MGLNFVLGAKRERVPELSGKGTDPRALENGRSGAGSPLAAGRAWRSRQEGPLSPPHPPAPFPCQCPAWSPHPLAAGRHRGAGAETLSPVPSPPRGQSHCPSEMQPNYVAGGKQDLWVPIAPKHILGISKKMPTASDQNDSSLCRACLPPVAGPRGARHHVPPSDTSDGDQMPPALS